MSFDKRSRTITLQCPTCGGSAFKSETNENPEVKCIGCERVIRRDELIQENSETIQEHLDKMKRDIVKDAADQMRKTLKNAFKGNKNIKLK